MVMWQLESAKDRDMEVRVRTKGWEMGNNSYRCRRTGTWQREFAKNGGDESVTVSTKDGDVTVRVGKQGRGSGRDSCD